MVGTEISSTNCDSNVISDESFSESDEEVSTNNIPKGKPKSGKFWKSQKTRAASIIKTRGLQSSLEKKMKLRKDLRHTKLMSREILEEAKKKKEELKIKRRENIKKMEENQRKAEIVQVIKNPQKIKKMKKKQLRSIEKRDTLQIGGK
ncbi:coiled-coil domain-containing protein 86 [Nilaparvata lugens]|uniref:coiled-coil domain-containing protein 86 n=1 Tax=Nilaparvata lugens TaxID=108931 RepID=UPI00193D5428|nr:coiled-coil domain-containing protein 86 [Nilaparvata lugens]